MGVGFDIIDTDRMGRILVAHSRELDLSWGCVIDWPRRAHTRREARALATCALVGEGRGLRGCVTAQGQVDIADAGVCDLIVKLACDHWSYGDECLGLYRLFPMFDVTDVAIELFRDPTALGCLAEIAVMTCAEFADMGVCRQAFTSYYTLSRDEGGPCLYALGLS